MWFFGCFGTLYGDGICLNKMFMLGSPALQKTPTKGSQQGVDAAHLGGANLVQKLFTLKQREIYFVKIGLVDIIFNYTVI